MTFVHKFSSGVYCRMTVVDQPQRDYVIGWLYSEEPTSNTFQEFRTWQNEVVAKTLVQVWGLDFLCCVDGWEQWGLNDEPLVLIESSEYHDSQGEDSDWWKGE